MSTIKQVLEDTDSFINLLKQDNSNSWNALNIAYYRIARYINPNPQILEKLIGPVIETTRNNSFKANTRRFAAKVLSNFKDPRAIDPLIDLYLEAENKTTTPFSGKPDYLATYEQINQIIKYGSEKQKEGWKRLESRSPEYVGYENDEGYGHETPSSDPEYGAAGDYE